MNQAMQNLLSYQPVAAWKSLWEHSSPGTTADRYELIDDSDLPIRPESSLLVPETISPMQLKQDISGLPSDWSDMPYHLQLLHLFLYMPMDYPCPDLSREEAKIGR